MDRQHLAGEFVGASRWVGGVTAWADSGAPKLVPLAVLGVDNPPDGSAIVGFSAGHLRCARGRRLGCAAVGGCGGRLMVGRISSPRFVGRVAELEALEELLRHAASGNGGAMLVAGEAGIGKSRLVVELG